MLMELRRLAHESVSGKTHICWGLLGDCNVLLLMVVTKVFTIYLFIIVICYLILS